MSRLRPKLAALLGAGLATTAAVTLAASPVHAAPIVTVQVIGINDFHGRLAPNPGNREGGAAVLAGAVKQLRAAEPNTVFAAAGDLIGATTFDSFIAQDKPTIDALNAAGLDVSAVGNHELDMGYDDLVDRVMAPESGANPYGGAGWEYIAANLKKSSNPTEQVDEIAESWYDDFGDIRVGFVGAVTEDLPSLVSPAGIADLAVADIVDSVSDAADDLTTTDGADIVVLLIHEGAANTSLEATTDTSTAWGAIVDGVGANPNFDAIISGHTHLAYNHALADFHGRTLPFPVVSAGQYGMNLNQLLFSVDDATDTVTGITQNIIALTNTDGTPAYPADATTEAIVAAAADNAEVLGAVPLGYVAGPFMRGVAADGSESRGAESTIGNLVAEVHRWATSAPENGAAEIAFMNPGGIRADMTGASYPAQLTYRDAATVQPFANTLVNMDMTGAQIKQVLEEQWQRDGEGNVPPRAFLRLGVSAGFEYTYDPSRPEGDRITGMWLNNAAILAGTTYSVTANSFLAAGGDNFRGFQSASDTTDTGKIDLAAMVDYMAQFPTADAALEVSYDQRAIGVSFPPGSGPFYPGGPVDIEVSSLTWSGAADQKDSQVVVRMGNRVMGTFPIDNTIGDAKFDEYGTASVSILLSTGAAPGNHVLTLETDNTFTSTVVPITLQATVPGVDPVAPSRLLDTRIGDQFVTVDGEFRGTGPIATRDRIELDVAGRGGVPANAQSVVLNVTAVAPATAGYLTVYPCGTARPNASNVNFVAGQVVPNVVVAKVGTGGRVCVYSSAATDVVVDVNGFVPVGGALTGVDPARLADSRSGQATVDAQQAGGGRLAADAVFEVDVANRGGVPADAAAVFLNVTAVNPAAAGYLTVYPCGTTRPTASNVNYVTGEVVPNAVIAKIGTGGKVCIYTKAATDLVVDVTGFVPAGGALAALSPARLLDTRTGAQFVTVDNQHQGGGPIAADGVYELTVAGRGGATAPAAVFLNVTAVNPAAAGYITVWDCDGERPTASNVNYLAGEVAANAVLAEVNADGEVCFYTKAATDLVVDVNAFVP